jgi:hypothetical protein
MPADVIDFEVMFCDRTAAAAISTRYGVLTSVKRVPADAR